MTEKQYPSDKQDKFMLRLPEGMRDRIKLESEKSGRSMNAEIIARLNRSFTESDRPDSDVIESLRDELREVRKEVRQLRELYKGGPAFIREKQGK